MKVLLADASATNRDNLSQALRSWGYGVETFATGSEVWYALETQIAPALVILGELLDGLDALEICRRARLRVGYPTTYIVTFSKPGQRQTFGEALEAGADDYLVKPFALEELNLRLQKGRRVLKLEADLEAARLQLESRTRHDALTGAWERDTILEHLDREILRARREEVFVGVLMADIDHLDEINEDFGRPIGDVVLKETVNHLRTALRPYDALGRVGDDEFLIVLAGCDDARALRVARRVQASLAHDGIPAFQGARNITMGIGIATNKLDPNVDGDTLLMVAQQALRTAKTVGANGLVAGQFTPPTEIPEF